MTILLLDFKSHNLVIVCFVYVCVCDILFFYCISDGMDDKIVETETLGI